MKATIYGLIDPNTNHVRYVGRTTKTVAGRLHEHLNAASLGKNRHPVYDWIRSLRPNLPIVVVLQEGIEVERKGSGTFSERRWWRTDAAAETKWMKRFERSGLLCTVQRDSAVYKSLTNTTTVKCMKVARKGLRVLRIAARKKQQ